MRYTDVRATHFPYCLCRTENGYAVLGRNYKPVGHDQNKWYDYSQHEWPIGEDTIAELVAAGCKTDRDGWVYFYDDGDNPVFDEKDMEKYLAKLKILMVARLVIPL